MRRFNWGRSGLAGLAGLIVLAGLGALPARAAEGETISGPTSIVDADILMVNNQRVILWGVDAPERSQLCLVGNKKWGCNSAAKEALAAIIGTGEASCTLTEGKPDPFGRRFGVCTVGGKDIGAELVKQGMAWAYVDQTADYQPQEDEAKAAKLGVWQNGARIDFPWEWRRTRTPGGFR